MEVLVAVLGSSALATLVSSIFNIITAKRNTNSGVEAGVQILLYDRLKCLGRKYILDQHVSTDDLEDFLRMYQIYNTLYSKQKSASCHLGGEFLDDLVAQVRKVYMVS